MRMECFLRSRTEPCQFGATRTCCACARVSQVQNIAKGDKIEKNVRVVKCSVYRCW